MPHVSGGEHHKGFQQVRCSSAHFHFVRQRESLYHRLASESLAWSFFYGPSYPECTIFTGAHDNRGVVDKVDGGWWGIWGGGEQMSKSIYSGRTPRGHRALRNTLQWPDEIVIFTCVCVCVCGLVHDPNSPQFAATKRNKMKCGQRIKSLNTRLLLFLLFVSPDYSTYDFFLVYTKIL